MMQNTQDYMISPQNYESSKLCFATVLNCHTFRVCANARGFIKNGGHVRTTKCMIDHRCGPIMLQNTNSSFDQTNQISHSNLEISIIFAEYERNISNSKFIYFDHPKKKI